jgi:hypothetical protein
MPKYVLDNENRTSVLLAKEVPTSKALQRVKPVFLFFLLMGIMLALLFTIKYGSSIEGRPCDRHKIALYNVTTSKHNKKILTCFLTSV